MNSEKRNQRYQHIIFLFILFFFNLIQESYSQRIIGYYPNYRYTAASASNVQYTKLTHLYYFSLNPTKTAVAGQSNGSLWYNDGFSWFTTTNFNDVVAKARAANPAIKIIIVSGGAPGGDWDLSDRFEYIGNNPAILNTFCNNIISFIVDNNLDGWDLDWEYPKTVSAKSSHQKMLTLMRTKIDSLKAAACRNYELTIAVGGGYTDLTSPRECWGESHTDFINAASIDLIDFLNIMVYDAPVGGPPCSFASHQHYDVVVKSFNDWRTAFPGLPASKIGIGVGFYDNSFTKFNSIGNVSTRYNATYWNGGSGCPNMQSKIDFARTNGTSGIFIWEITEDNLCVGSAPSCYSLLDCIFQYTTSTWGTWSSSDPCATPVQLTHLSGSNFGHVNTLKWATATEQNNERFDIEKSTDGVNFRVIGSISGSGNSSTQIDYNYSDRDLSPATVYYRLNQHDYSGASALSQTISIVAKANTNQYAASPNPFEDKLTILVNDPEQIGQAIRVTITDLLGHLVLNKEYIVVEGKIEVKETLAPSMYICTLISDKGSHSMTVIKK